MKTREVFCLVQTPMTGPADLSVCDGKERQNFRDIFVKCACFSTRSFHINRKQNMITMSSIMTYTTHGSLNKYLQTHD